jgi:hypothetical protein
MNSLGDSTAVLTTKVLPQHQSAITLLGVLLGAADAKTVEWLDLACGKGQIIAQFDKNVPEAAVRAKVAYHAYDIDNEHTRTAEKLANELGFKAVNVRVGEMDNFANVFHPDQKFSFISFTNTVHEIRPGFIGNLIIDLILRLDEGGVLYMYDMETLPVPELGAVPWDGSDVKKLLLTIIKTLGGNELPLITQTWEHSTCTGWSVNLQRNQLHLSDENIAARAKEAAKSAAGTIEEILRAKVKVAAAALEALTRYGARSEEDRRRAAKSLNEYWSLRRALGESV